MKCLLALAAALLLAVPAAAQERITSFDSQLHVQKDGLLDVVETIHVVADGTNIRHGIYRDFPTRYRTPSGGAMKVHFQLLGTERDGAPEPNSIDGLSNGVRIKIGHPDSEVSAGAHEYRIHYTVSREIGRYDGFDELYWNVTGNGWIFPIERASATIHLPSPVRFGQRAVYTGAQGSSAAQAEVVDEAPGRIAFATTAPLSSYEGLTVAAAFPKGVVNAPSRSQQAAWFLADYGPHALGALGFLATIGFVLFAWNRVGRDPRPGTVVPLFTPPDELSPAAMRYIETMAFDDRSFAATLVDWGVRGQVKLVDTDGGWLSKGKRSIVRTIGVHPLSGVEAEALEALVGDQGSVEMDNDNHERFLSAMEKLRDDLKARYEGTMFRRNTVWAAGALGIMAAFAWLTALSYGFVQGTALAPLGMASVISLAAGGLLLFIGARSSTTGKCLFGAAGLILAFVGVAATFPFVAASIAGGGMIAVFLPLLALPVVVLGLWLMSAPTPQGRAVMDRIAGFKQYLSIAEGERLDRMTGARDGGPQDLRTFEKFLPFAIALNVENQWADRFAGQLAAASATQQAGTFAWYSGSHQPWNDAGGFVEDIGDSLSSAVSSSSTAPGSSSGSGGGGFSGGGGGGGGGGGW